MTLRGMKRALNGEMPPTPFPGLRGQHPLKTRKNWEKVPKRLATGRCPGQDPHQSLRSWWGLGSPDRGEVERLAVACQDGLAQGGVFRFF